MEINRIWAMPNRNTFSIKPIKELVNKYILAKPRDQEIIIDPFANNCSIGTITNDLNPKFNTTYHMDALDFLKMLEDESADVVLYDPPYSLRQVKECYEGVGITVTSEHTKASWRAKHLDEIARILKPNGVCLCFGWNSNGVGIKRGFDMIEILLVPHGGSKNDTLCTVERKRS
jgi:hypothetical protein